MYLVFKFIVVFFQNLNGFRIGHMAEFGIQHVLKPFDQPLVHELVEKCHFLRRVFQDITDDVFQHAFRQNHIVLQIREAHLRLDHPELRRMTGGVGIFRPEGGAEGINVAEGKGIGFRVKLSAHRQVGGLSEEILAVVHLSVLCLRDIFQIQRGHLEHFSRALTVASRDQRSMHIDKASFLEKAVDGVSRKGADTEYRLKGVGSCAQMGNGAQIFEAVALLLKRIIGRGSALNDNLLRLHLKRLLRSGRLHDGSGYDYRSTHADFGDGREIGKLIGINHLKRLKKAAVIHDKESKGFGIPVASHPASDCHFFSRIAFLFSEQILNVCQFHCIKPLFTPLWPFFS